MSKRIILYTVIGLLIFSAYFLGWKLFSTDMRGTSFLGGFSTPNFQTQYIKSQNIKTASFLIENPSLAENDAFFIFPANATITKVTGVNMTVQDTVTFNLFYENTRASTTPSALFANYVTIISTTTPTATTTFLNSSPSAGNVLRFVTNAASSTQFLLTVDYYLR